MYYQESQRNLNSETQSSVYAKMRFLNSPLLYAGLRFALLLVKVMESSATQRTSEQ